MKLLLPENLAFADKMKAGPRHIQKPGAVFTDLGLLGYSLALDLQIRTRDRIIQFPGEPDHIFFVEHPRVYTLGRRGGQENLMVSPSFLESENIPVVQTGRGGNITFHCPGQAVLYPVVHLERAKISVKDFVFGLEEIMKLTAAEFGVACARDPENRGLWVGKDKIGSVGLAVKKGVSIHGLALNVNPDLTPFSWINPCGLKNLSMTSIKKEQEALLPDHSLLLDLSMDQVKEKLFHHFCSVFNFVRLEETHERTPPGP